MKTAFIASLAAAAVVCAACSDADRDPFGSNRSNASPTDSTTALTVMPAADTVMVGDSVQFTAATTDSQPVSWTVGDSTVARIVGTLGTSVLVRGLQSGSTTVIATSGGRSGSARLVVTARGTGGGAVASVTVTPSLDTLLAGDTIRFDATPRDSQGNRLGDRPVVWTLGDTSIARIENRTSQSAWVRGLKSGSTTLTATSEGHSGSAQVVVTTPPPVASVSVTPPADTVVVGDDSVFFSATLRDAQGRPLYGRTVTWAISDTSVARIVSSYGPYVSFRPLKPGSAVVTATSEGKTGTAQLAVIAPPPVASVSVLPPNDTVAAGDTVGFRVILRDATGNPVYGRSVTWSVGDPSVARIEQATGTEVALRALQEGTTMVTAASEGKSGTAQLVVTVPGPVASVTVSPSVDSGLVVGDTTVFSATPRDAPGNP